MKHLPNYLMQGKLFSLAGCLAVVEAEVALAACDVVAPIHLQNCNAVPGARHATRVPGSNINIHKSSK